MREGRQESERALRIALVLSEMKGDATDEMPKRIDSA